MDILFKAAGTTAGVLFWVTHYMVLEKSYYPHPHSQFQNWVHDNLGTTYESSKVSLGLRTLVVLVERRGRAAQDVISRCLLPIRPVVMVEVLVEMVVVVLVVVAVAVAVAVAMTGMVTMAVEVAVAIAVLVTVTVAEVAFFGVSPSWEKGGQITFIRFSFLEHLFINDLNAKPTKKQDKGGHRRW